MAEEFTATAKVRVTMEIDLTQPWGDEEVGKITKRARDQVNMKVKKLIKDEPRVSLVDVGDVFITLHSTK